MNGTKSSGISVKVSPNGIHALLPGHHIRHPYHHTCKLCGPETAHVCLLPRRRICRHVCLSHHTSNNVHLCYKCTLLTGMLGTPALNQCACLLYLYQTSNPAINANGSVDILTVMACLIMWHRTSTHV